MPDEVFWKSKPPVGVAVNQSHPLANGLIFFTPLNEASGRLVSSIAGTPVQGQFQGTYAWKGSRFGPVVGGSGAGNRIDIPTPEAVRILKNSITVAAIIKPGVTSRADHVSRWVSGSAKFMLTSGITASKWQFWVGVTVELVGTATGPTNVSTSRYDFVVGTFDGATARCFVNGNLEGSVAPAGSDLLIAGTEPIKLGASGDAAGNGDIAWCGIWNRPLSPYEIKLLYAEPWAFMAAPAWRRYFVPSGGAVTLDVPTAATLSTTNQKDVATAAALARTEAKDALTAAALGLILTKDVPTEAALATTNQADVPTAAALTTTNIKDVPTAAALALTALADVASAAALSRTEVKDVATAASLEVTGSGTQDVATSAALSVTVLKDVTTGAALSRLEEKDVASAAALARTEISEVPTAAALATTNLKDVTTQAVLNTTNVRDVVSVAALSRLELKDVPSAAALAMTATLSVPTAAALGLIGVKDVPTAAALTLTGIRDVAFVAALSRAEVRDVATVAALSIPMAPSLRIIARRAHYTSAIIRRAGYTPAIIRRAEYDEVQG